MSRGKWVEKGEGGGFIACAGTKIGWCFRSAPGKSIVPLAPQFSTQVEFGCFGSVFFAWEICFVRGLLG